MKLKPTGVPNTYESYSKIAQFSEKKISSSEFASAHVSLQEQHSFRRNEVKKADRRRWEMSRRYQK
jgi:hypothetical protein